MTLSKRLAELGIDLPQVAAPVAAYVPAICTPAFGDASASIVRTSGQLPMVAGQLVEVGLVSDQAKTATGFSQVYIDAEGVRNSLEAPLVSPERAYDCAKICALNALSAAVEAAGGVDRIAQVLKVTVFVASARDFYGQAQVANGVSELYGKLFEQGHIRSAIGVSVLPLNTPVEVEVEFLAR